jgi:signal transduction histidine kinase
MQERRKRGIGKVQYTLRFLNIALIVAIVFILLAFYALGKVVTDSQYSLVWRINLIILQLSFTAVIFAFLIGMFLLLHRTLGVLPRMEETLDKVLKGDYAQRIHIRKEDIMRSFVDKLNKVFELLQKTK